MSTTNLSVGNQLLLRTEIVIKNVDVKRTLEGNKQNAMMAFITMYNGCYPHGAHYSQIWSNKEPKSRSIQLSNELEIGDNTSTVYNTSLIEQTEGVSASNSYTIKLRRYL